MNRLSHVDRFALLRDWTSSAAYANFASVSGSCNPVTTTGEAFTCEECKPENGRSGARLTHLGVALIDRGVNSPNVMLWRVNIVHSDSPFCPSLSPSPSAPTAK